MILKYNINIEENAFKDDFKRLTNQIYKLLPSREEGLDWNKILNTILEELSGLSRLFFDQQSTLLILLSKLEGLFILTDMKDFPLYRKTIFECLNLMNKLKENVCT